MQATTMLSGLKPTGRPKRLWLALTICLVLFLIGLVFVSIGSRRLHQLERSSRMGSTIESSTAVRPARAAAARNPVGTVTN
jgi:hypothetical protein